ncbi:hypothetical protein BJY01DRAFT_250480 [Aspergillus pseudoustus]|uniref:Uncharacterized protein n=1 Tax=Aspergillus pseudoustus TaxID=1810923 RepID=A0ABR4JK85_9EURO
MSFLTIPLTILEAIFVFALDLPVRAGYTLDGEKRRTVVPWGDITQNTKGTKEFIRAANSLFLASRHLHEIVAPLFYSRTTFAFEDVDCLGAFLDTIGASNRQSLRYVAINLEREDPSKDDGGYDEGVLTATFLRKTTQTLSNLPVALRAMWIYFPFEERSLAIDEETGTVHQPLRAALQRFKGIEELALVGYPHEVIWDILCDSKGCLGAKKEVSPVFLSLSALRLEGRLPSTVGSVGLTAALSVANLPCLTHLEFQGLDDKAGSEDQAEPSFLADAIQAMRPLQTFRWLRGSEPYSRAFRGPPVPQLLHDLHLRALISRHMDTLREVEIDLAGSLARAYAMGITAGSLAAVLNSLTDLQRATIVAPFLDLVKLFQAIVGSDANNSLSPLPSRHTLFRSLESLRLTLGSEEDTLNIALDSGELSRLFLCTNLYKVSQFRLRVVIGTRPEITKFVRSHKILRDNVKLYPELEQALLACMTERRHRSSILTNGEKKQAAREDWWALSLVDVYDYSPFWDDVRDVW